MRLVALVNITHSGVSYSIGEIMEDIKKADATRLIDLSAAKGIKEDGKTIKANKEEINKKKHELIKRKMSNKGS